MSGFLLDTNIASHIIRGDRPELSRRLTVTLMNEIAISAVTEAELYFGLAKRNYPTGLSERVRQFLLRVDVLPWDHKISQIYGDLRATCEAKGTPLAPLDMMIAAHAVATNRVLVTRDRAFDKIAGPLRQDDWMGPSR